MARFAPYLFFVVLVLAGDALSSGMAAGAALDHSRASDFEIHLMATGNTDQNNPTPITWDANVTYFRGQNGQQFTFTCPPNGSPQAIWGTDTYTDDSSVCTAAVHAGLITFATGGVVTIEIRPGEASYAASDWNGVSSSPYGPWDGSFVILISWESNVTHRRGQNGQQFTFTCPPNGSPQAIWGTDTYTDDSSVCTAAVHAGLITFATGGVVTIEIRPGEASYAASDWNGVSSSPYGPWDGSFVILPQR